MNTELTRYVIKRTLPNGEVTYATVAPGRHSMFEAQAYVMEDYEAKERMDYLVQAFGATVDHQDQLAWYTVTFKSGSGNLVYSVEPVRVTFVREQ